MAVNCGVPRSWKPEAKPNLGCHSNINISIPNISFFVSSKMTELRLFKCQGLLVTRWHWPLACDLECSCFVRFCFVICNLVMWLLYSHCFPYNMPSEPTPLNMNMFKVTPWRHWWCNRSLNSFIVPNLPSSVHICSEIEPIMCKTWVCY